MISSEEMLRKCFYLINQRKENLYSYHIESHERYKLPTVERLGEKLGLVGRNDLVVKAKHQNHTHTYYYQHVTDSDRQPSLKTPL